MFKRKLELCRVGFFFLERLDRGPSPVGHGTSVLQSLQQLCFKVTIAPQQRWQAALPPEGVTAAALR